MKTLALLALLLCTSSCGRQSPASAPVSPSDVLGPHVPNGPTIPVPAFTIRIVLTQDAAEKLAGAGETIHGSIYFDGDGTPLPNVKTAPWRSAFLGWYEFEMSGPGEVTVSDAVISQEAYDRLSDTNYHFTINVSSGRRAFTDNVLDGGVAGGRLTNLDSNRPFEIKCGLL
jgi:hypothetical protein